jgi:zinc protease
MNRVSTDQAYGFIKNCLNPGDYTFIFTGNININEIRELSAAYIASIPNSPLMNSWTDPGVVHPGKTEKRINRGMEESSMVYLGWFAPGPADFNEERNQTAAVLSEYLDIILTDEIREKLGGVYSISAGASVTTIPKGEYRLNVYFNCNPARVNELITAVRDQLTQLVSRPLNQDTFNKSMEALLREHENSIQRNLHIAQSYANSAVIFRSPLSRLYNRPGLFRAVTTGDIQRTAAELLRGNAVRLVLYPEG